MAKVGTSNPDRTISLKRLQSVVENNNNNYYYYYYHYYYYYYYMVPNVFKDIRKTDDD